MRLVSALKSRIDFTPHRLYIILTFRSRTLCTSKCLVCALKLSKHCTNLLLNTTHLDFRHNKIPDEIETFFVQFLRVSVDKRLPIKKGVNWIFCSHTQYWFAYHNTSFLPYSWVFQVYFWGFGNSNLGNSLHTGSCSKEWLKQFTGMYGKIFWARTHISDVLYQK